MINSLLENRFHQNIFSRGMDIHCNKWKMLEDEHDKQVRKHSGPLNKKESTREENYKQVLTSTREPLKK